MHLRVTVTANDNSETPEVSDFYGDDAQAQFNSWQIARGEFFGADEKRSIAIEDLTLGDQQTQKVLSKEEVRAGCLKIIDQIAAINDASGQTVDQMDALFSTPATSEILLALLAGAVGAARRKILVVGPTLYPQSVVDQIVASLSVLEGKPPQA